MDTDMTLLFSEHRKTTSSKLYMKNAPNSDGDRKLSGVTYER